jgi:hypothetical protein
MKILNRIILSFYSTAHGAYTEREEALIRPYKVTYKGAARILAKERGCKPSDLNVIRIETSIFA